MSKNIKEKIVPIENNGIVSEIFGELDENINMIANTLNINVILGDGSLKYMENPPKCRLGEKLLYKLIDIVKYKRN